MWNLSWARISPLICLESLNVRRCGTRQNDSKKVATMNKTEKREHSTGRCSFRRGAVKNNYPQMMLVLVENLREMSFLQTS